MADEREHRQVAVLGYGYWNRSFGQSCSAVGQVVYIKGFPFTPSSGPPGGARRKVFSLANTPYQFLVTRFELSRSCGGRCACWWISSS